MTVSEALSAHACAQMTAARAADDARRTAEDSDQVWSEQGRTAPERRSFVESWAVCATVIGVSRAN